MKRMLKKLAAIALTGAMVLSLSVSAFATTPTLGTATPTTSGAGAQGSASGWVESQGKIPDDVVRVRMPLSANDVFTMYVDPHNLIRESQNAMEVGGAGTAVDLFATDTLVYFPNRTEGSLTGFSKTSDPIEVTNMSNVPVTVDMTATWSMNGNTYKLAKNADDFAAAKTAGVASMYLTLDDSLNHSAAVVNADKGVPTLTYGVDRKATGAANVTTANTNTLKYLPSLIKDIKFEFTSEAVEEDIQLLNEGGPLYTGNTPSADIKTPSGWAITFTKVDKKTPTVAFDASKLPTYSTLTGTAPNQTLKRDNPYTVKVTGQNIGITASLQKDGTYVYSVPNGKAETVISFHKGTSSPAVANITIEWDYAAIADNGYDVEETLVDSTDDTKKDVYKMVVTGATGSGAKLLNDLNTTEDSYKLAKNAAGTALEWVFNDDKGFSADTPEKFQSISFSLTAAITDGEVCAAAWDDAFDATKKSELVVVWKADKCSAVDPVAVVTSPLESSTGTATLTVDWGYGDKKTTTISAATYGADKTALDAANIAIDGNTVTITSVAALYASGGANGVITLTFKHTGTGYEKDITVNLKEAVS